MTVFKPFIRISILSFILSMLLIYLGIKYHWGDFVPAKTNQSLELDIPDKQLENTKQNFSIDNNGEDVVSQDSFDPKLINTKQSNTLLASMNKEQITEQCTNLTSKQGLQSSLLDLAIVNCVVSNYEETFQNSSDNIAKNKIYLQKKRLYSQQCQQQVNSNSQYSSLEKQLLVGICVSDRLNN